MKKLIAMGTVGLTSILYCLSFAPATLRAQDEGKAVMTLTDVKDRLKENKNFLEDAKKRGKAGDAAGIDTALQNFDRNMDGINRAMSSGGFQGDASQREEAFDRVEKATRKHGEVLANLLTKVPEQARPHIQHAIDVSQKGRTTALANLESVRGERQQQEQAEMRRQQQMGGPMGRPDATGRSGGMGGPGGGMGAGRSAGAGGGAGAGASAGRGPR